jgi:hypothetical protein
MGGQMKCVSEVYCCCRISFSGNGKCCGILLSTGETKFINKDGEINGECPLKNHPEPYLE